MQITYDPNKSAANIEQRGLSFECARDFDFSTALIIEDLRHPYPEPRYQALGYMGERLHMLVFTPQTEGVRVISFRKANQREVKHYEQATEP